MRTWITRGPGQPLDLSADMRVTPDDAALAGGMPRISAGVFYDTPAAELSLKAVLNDRRMKRVTSHIAAGGIAAAVAYCSTEPTPDLLILETKADGADILAGLQSLALVCNENAKVIVIGRPNDIGLYRNMVADGVSDYLLAPADPLATLAAVLKLYKSEAAVRTGRICAFLGAKGGVGASTLAQNVAWCIGKNRSGPVMLADLDLQFGTVALNLNLNPSAGFSEQAKDPDRLDEALLERTLIQSGNYLHVLPAAGRMQEIGPPDLAAVEKLLDLSRKLFPVVVLDLPHLQSPWMKAVLAAVDDLVIVAAPDLANLRNAKCMIDVFRLTRPHDAPPRIVLNQVGIQRRAGITPADFAKALETEIPIRIGFDPMTFAGAANAGRLIAETTPNCAAGVAIAALARDIDKTRIAGGTAAGNSWQRFRMRWASAN